MNPVHALRSPLALFTMPKRSWGILALYLLGCSLVLGLAAWGIVSFAGDAEDAFVSFLFPEAWHGAVDLLVERYFEDQRRKIIINAAAGGGLMLVTVTLFPVKEMLSASFEKHGTLTFEAQSEHPLWEQAWEEIKLFVIFLTVQGCLFWLSYFPGIWNVRVATLLSYAFLFFTYAIDFVSPLFQRHKGYYSQIIKVLLKRPVTSLVFGGLFASPVLILANLWHVDPNGSNSHQIFILASVNVVTIAWAAVSGTWLASKMFPLFKNTKRTIKPLRILTAMLVIVAFAANVFVFAVVGKALIGKSQVLKCDYDVEWTSFDIDFPGISETLSTGRLELGVSFNVKVHNPTDLDVEIEKSRLTISHQNDAVAESTLQPLAVKAGDTVTQRVSFSQDISPMQLKKGRSLFKAKSWDITLHVKMTDDIDFPIYLVHPDKR